MHLSWHDYIGLGWSVFPLREGTKVPKVPWKQYQTRHPTPEEIAEWSRGEGQPCLAVVCGQISGIIVLDIDGIEGWEWLAEHHVHLPVTATAQSLPGWEGNIKGKQHMYFRHPGGYVQNRTGSGAIHTNLELKGDGGYIVLPPSLHAPEDKESKKPGPVPEGWRYKWLTGMSPEECGIEVCPEWLLRCLKFDARSTASGLVMISDKDQLPPAPEGDDWDRLVGTGVMQGERHDMLCKIAGHYLGIGMNENVALSLLRGWNCLNAPPLPDQEVMRAVSDFARNERAKHPAPDPIGGRPDGAPGEDGGSGGVGAGNWEKRKREKLDKISQYLKLPPLASIRKVAASDPLYQIEFIDGRKIEGITVPTMANQIQFRSKVFSCIEIVIPKFGAKAAPNWEGIMQLIADVVEVGDPGEESTIGGQIRKGIMEYLRENPPEDRFRAKKPILDPDGDVWVKLSDFHRWMVVHQQSRMEQRELATHLYTQDLYPERISIYGGQTRVWRVPKRLVPERKQKAPAPKGEGAFIDDQQVMH